MVNQNKAGKLKKKAQNVDIVFGFFEQQRLEVENKKKTSFGACEGNTKKKGKIQLCYGKTEDHGNAHGNKKRETLPHGNKYGKKKRETLPHGNKHGEKKRKEFYHGNKHGKKKKVKNHLWKQTWE